MNVIFLYGAPASGKTTLGRKLAAKQGAKFIDLDVAIESQAGRPISAIFASGGEAAFRTLESKVLRQVVNEAQVSRMVVSLGGGTLLNAANRAFCEERGLVLCLETPSDEELERRMSRSNRRPLGNMAHERRAHYASFPHRLVASFETGPSLILVGCGFAPAILADLPFVADATVDGLYRSRLGAPLAVIPSGERHKTSQTVMNLWSAFAQKGLGRRDVVAAVGGGVTGDLTGFAAATWMRGIDWINVPTTLLAMVDASTGGKTGCDLPEGKNLAGAFHMPRLVAIDTDFLSTLPAPLIAAGKAEMIKHQLVGGLGNLGTDPCEIAKNLRVKVEIVKNDPCERLGLRVLLNCGHTVAHAVEKLSNYTISHGEAVAIGCVVEARLAVYRGLAPETWPAEVARHFKDVGLPTELPEGMTFEILRPVMLGDKKREGSVVHFALPCGWGDVRSVPIDLSGAVER